MEDISIHAPREGGDTDRHRCRRTLRHFNPRPPRGGRQYYMVPFNDKEHFNPRPPRGGRRCGSMVSLLNTNISIHAPREGGDFILPNTICAPEGFQSTPPARGATASGVVTSRAIAISIHAPREGGDWSKSRRQVGTVSHFNPRPPRGGRLVKIAPTSWNSIAFQSTPPARGATLCTN